MYTFCLKGETPSKKNNRITLRNGKTIPSKGFRDWHKIAMLQMQTQKQKQKLFKPIESKVHIKVSFYHGDKRKRDSDNAFTSLMDLLVDSKVLQDDNWKIVGDYEVHNIYKKNNAYVQIEIIESL